MFKLGTIVTDKATGLKGALMHLQIEGADLRFYNFQPTGLHPEDGTPIERKWITADRVIGGVEVPEADLPLNAIGTEAEDSVTGFKGTVFAVTLHHSGCIHLHLQPKGRHPKTGAAMETQDFDIRLLRGKAIQQITDAERDTSQRQKPSPTDCGRVNLRQPSIGTSALR